MTAARWGGVCRPKQGQTVSGDTYLVLPEDDGILATVIDGLGGGVEAARAAEGAATVIRSLPGRPLQELTQRAHTAIHGTRGAVIGLLRLEFGARRLSYIGVGNIGIHVYSRRSIKPISKNGILGYRMPTLLELSYVFDPGDLFVLFSDGISSRFILDSATNIAVEPQVLAEALLERYGKTIDDATVLAIKTSDDTL